MNVADGALLNYDKMTIVRLKNVDVLLHLDIQFYTLIVYSVTMINLSLKLNMMGQQSRANSRHNRYLFVFMLHTLSL